MQPQMANKNNIQHKHRTAANAEDLEGRACSRATWFNTTTDPQKLLWRRLHTACSRSKNVTTVDTQNSYTYNCTRIRCRALLYSCLFAVVPYKSLLLLVLRGHSSWLCHSPAVFLGVYNATAAPKNPHKFLSDAASSVQRDSEVSILVWRGAVVHQALGGMLGDT